MPGFEDNYILVVDDDEGVLTFMETVLRLEGHRVLSATSGARAIELANQWGAESMGLLVTDIMMPDMDGYALAARFASCNSSLRVLYVSGFTEKELGARTDVHPSAPVLGKPFSANELRATVHEIMAARCSP